jgi:hypothetical protein
MRLWRIENVNGTVYVQSLNEDRASAIAKAATGYPTMGTSPVQSGSTDGVPNAAIFTQTSKGIQRVGTISNPADLAPLVDFSSGMTTDEFFNNLSIDARYGIGGAPKTMNAPSGDGIYDPNADVGARPEIDTGSKKNPFLPEEIGGANVAFDRALQSIGYDKGVLGSISRSKFAPLNALAMLGKAGGADTEMFQNLGAGRELQDFFSKALGRISGGRDPGATATYDMPGEATALFNQQVDPSSDLYNFYNPQIGMGRGQAGVGEGLSGYDAAELVAQLGLSGLGAKRFGGAFSSMLPSAQNLVSGFQSQPIDSPTAQNDIRAYIRDRLTA